MAFLDNFSFAFQDIIWKEKIYNTWKYWEKIQQNEIEHNFKWIILERGKFSNFSLDQNNLIIVWEKEYELRSPLDIKPKKWDIIIRDSNSFRVEFVETIMFNWEKDHILSILKYFE